MCKISIFNIREMGRNFQSSADTRRVVTLTVQLEMETCFEVPDLCSWSFSYIQHSSFCLASPQTALRRPLVEQSFRIRSTKIFPVLQRRNWHESVSLAMRGKKDRWFSMVSPRLYSVTDGKIWELSREITSSCHGDVSLGMYNSSSLLELGFSWWAAIREEISARHGEIHAETLMSEGEKKVSCGSWAWKPIWG